MADILFEVIVLSLIVWWISNMVRYEDGPFGVFSKLQDLAFSKSSSVPRGILGVLGYLGFQIITCFSCTITVVSGGLSALTQNDLGRFIIIWLAVTGLARFMDYLAVPHTEEIIVPPLDINVESEYDESTTMSLP